MLGYVRLFLGEVDECPDSAHDLRVKRVEYEIKCDKSGCGS
jgi:hypothetical protein